MARFYEGLKDV
ncbi:hypothetical protein BN1708_019469, partial [Verticillium longisporum]